MSYVARLTDGVPRSTNLPVYARTVRRLAGLRTLQDAAASGDQLGNVDRLARQWLSDIDAGAGDTGDDWRGAFQSLDEVPAVDETYPVARMLAWPGRVAAIHGPAGSGKSRALAAAAAAVSRGVPFMNQRVDEPGRCLWIAFEGLSDSRALLQTHGADLSRVVLGPGSALVSGPGEWGVRLEALIADPQPTWIVVDSFAALAAATGIDSNNADEVTRILAPLVTAAADGAAVSFTHHEPHEANRLRNSTAILAAVDVTIRVTHDLPERLTTFDAGCVGGKVRFGIVHDIKVQARLSDDGQRFDVYVDGPEPAPAGPTPNGSGPAIDPDKVLGYLSNLPTDARQMMRSTASVCRAVLGTAGGRIQGEMSRLLRGLASDGYVVASSGARGAQLWTVTRDRSGTPAPIPPERSERSVQVSDATVPVDRSQNPPPVGGGNPERSVQVSDATVPGDRSGTLLPNETGTVESGPHFDGKPTRDTDTEGDTMPTLRTEPTADEIVAGVLAKRAEHRGATMPAETLAMLHQFMAGDDDVTEALRVALDAMPGAIYAGEIEIVRPSTVALMKVAPLLDMAPCNATMRQRARDLYAEPKGQQ